MNDVGRLANALLLGALRAFRVTPEGRRGPLVDALDVFIQAPGPVTYLQASRVLHDVEKAARVSRLGTAGMERALQRGIGTVAKVPDMDPTVVDRLKALPVDPRAGRRLEALAALVIAHQELAARAEAASLSLRKQLEKMQRRGSSVPPRGASTPPKGGRRKSGVEARR